MIYCFPKSYLHWSHWTEPCCLDCYCIRSVAFSIVSNPVWCFCFPIDAINIKILKIFRKAYFAQIFWQNKSICFLITLNPVYSIFPLFMFFFNFYHNICIQTKFNVFITRKIKICFKHSIIIASLGGKIPLNGFNRYYISNCSDFSFFVMDANEHPYYARIYYRQISFLLSLTVWIICLFVI